MPVTIEGLELRDGQVLRDGNLTVSVEGTEWDIGGSKGTYAGSTGNAVTDNDTNYVYLNDSGVLQINTTGFPASTVAHARLATVIAVGGVITNVVDKRANIQGTGGIGDVPSSRTLTAGAGLTGGGDLSADRTFDVVANVDGSIAVSANDIQVGVLATDAQHGTRGGGTQHLVATGVTSGFMSATDKAKLDGLSAGDDKSEQHLFYADMLIDIDDADWSVNANATAAMDTNDAAIQVRLFDDTVEEGTGFILSIPTGVTELTFSIKSRAETAPGSAQTVASTLHYREIPDNGAVGSWSQYDLADVNIPTNENWKYDTQLITLATLSMTAGRLYQFEFTRNAGDAGDTLSGDWAVVELGVVYDVPAIFNALFYGDQLDYPLDSDWNIDTPAPGSTDSNNAALSVRRFDDTIEEAVGFLLEIPGGTTQITVREKSRAETAPGASQNVARTLHYRKIGDDGAVGVWSTYDLAAIAMPTNENWQYDSQIVSASVLGVSAGSLYQWQLSRDTGDAGDTLVGDWALVELQMEFS